MITRIAACLVTVLWLGGCAWIERYMPAEIRAKISSDETAALQKHVVDESVDRLGTAVFQMRLRTVRVSAARRPEEVIQRVTTRLVNAAEGTPWAAVARKFAWEPKIVEDQRVDA